MAPKDNPGDTVAASVFAPIDTAALNRKARAKAAKLASIPDSADIFYVGQGSTKKQIQLVSYPSHRDTAVYNKTRHVKVQGNADFGHVVRVKFWVNGGDTLVQRIEALPLAH